MGSTMTLLERVLAHTATPRRRELARLTPPFATLTRSLANASLDERLSPYAARATGWHPGAGLTARNRRRVSARLRPMNGPRRVKIR